MRFEASKEPKKAAADIPAFLDRYNSVLRTNVNSILHKGVVSSSLVKLQMAYAGLIRDQKL